MLSLSSKAAGALESILHICAVNTFPRFFLNPLIVGKLSACNITTFWLGTSYGDVNYTVQGHQN